MDPLLHWRNEETLHRLAYLAEGRAAPSEYIVSRSPRASVGVAGA